MWHPAAAGADGNGIMQLYFGMNSSANQRWLQVVAASEPNFFSLQNTPSCHPR